MRVSSIDARVLRERYILLLGSLVIVFFIWNLLFSGPAERDMQQLKTKITALNVELAASKNANSRHHCAGDTSINAIKNQTIKGFA